MTAAEFELAVHNALETNRRIKSIQDWDQYYEQFREKMRRGN